MLAIIKQRKRSSTIPWDVDLHYARAEELPKVCIELYEFITDANSKRLNRTSISTGTIPTSLKAALVGVSWPSTKRKAGQLRDARARAHMHISDGNLLVEMVGSDIFGYRWGGYNIAFVASPEDLTS